MTTIPVGLCLDCSSLENIVIPSKVTAINQQAFLRTNLKTIEVKAATPPTLGTYAFGSGVGSVEVVYIPVGTLSSYETANGWKTFAGLFVEKEM